LAEYCTSDSQTLTEVRIKKSAMALSQLRHDTLSYLLPIYAVGIACFAYIARRVLLGFIYEDRKAFAPGASLDQAEKGSLKQQENLSDDEIFQLEKRAFFSKVGFFGSSL
jgi:hypothetical protein